MINLEDSLESVSGVRKNFIKYLKRLDIETVKDLLWHFPNRYEDFSEFSKIAELKIGQQATVQGVIESIKLRRTWKRRMFIVEATIIDNTGKIKAVWFNQRFLLSVLKKGKNINLSGKIVGSPNGEISLSHPVYEIINYNAITDQGIIDTKHTGRLVPVYSETRGITSRAIRFLIKPLIEKMEPLIEALPDYILKSQNLPEINTAIKNIHFPENIEEARIAKKRFAFEDLFFLQLANLRQRIKLLKEKAVALDIDIEYLKNLIVNLPFELTIAQKKSIWEILKNLNKPHPMNRLLQGDVGSGKTIVAALSALIVAKNNKQSAFMAPTEVLARQHYETFKKFFKYFDGGISLLTSSEARVFYGDELETKLKKQDLIKKISTKEIKIIIGTHALIQKNVNFNDLVFVVIDEQHRFGVRQRASLANNEGFIPHFLSMSATPIPRTLSLTIFGDLDLSIIDELPKDRKNIVTKIVAPANREKAYDFIREQVEKGRQVFVVCPRIEPADLEKNFFAFEARAVKEEYEKLSKKIFSDLKVDMLHGKM